MTEKTIIDDHALDLLFRQARTYGGWQTRDVSDALLEAVYELAKMGPTAFNAQPMRVLFVKSKDAKEKLKPCLAEGNVEKTMAAPVTAVVAYDETFYENLPRLFAHWPAAADGFRGKDNTVFLNRNGALGGAYLMMAARALGLDCGPMSGFDNAAVDAAFFAGTNWKSNFLVNLGYGDREKLHPRLPRLGFDEAAKIA